MASAMPSLTTACIHEEEQEPLSWWDCGIVILIQSMPIGTLVTTSGF